MADSPIPITKPVFGARELELMAKPLESGWVVQGPFVEQFERGIAAYTGIEHCRAVSSGTAALHLALLALGIGPGDEVLVPSFTYVATANAVEYVGARPILCDIDLATFNLDLEDASARLSGRTKAIIPVSQFGLGVVDDALYDFAAQAGIAIVEDDACALGAFVGDCHAGGRARLATFSFHPRKAITTGEGGMVATADEELAEAVTRLRNHGATLSVRQRQGRADGALLPEFDELGYNYRMTDIQGALGCAQVERLHHIMAERRHAAKRYDALLAGNHVVRPPVEPPKRIHAYQSYVVLVSGGGELSFDRIDELEARRDAIMVRMQEDGIGVRQGTHAVHALGFYTRRYGYMPESLPRSLLAERASIALPLFPGITAEQQERVVDRIVR